MTNQPFSLREGFRNGTNLVYDDAPDAIRIGIREVLHVLGYQRPTAQRQILCSALRITPDQNNWSDYPNVDFEVSQLIQTGPWYKFFDALERIPRFLPEQEVEPYYEATNGILADEGIGYRFDSGNLVRVGTEEFHGAVNDARTALEDEKFDEPRRQFERAYEFRNRLPPDWPNAIKEAVNSVEGVLQVIFDRPSVALPTIVSENLRPDGAVPSLGMANFESIGSYLRMRT